MAIGYFKAAMLLSIWGVLCVGYPNTDTRNLQDQKLLVILLDGVRYDYPDLDKTLLGFQRLERSGVRAEYVTPIYPSVSYPNWYTIVTGLYAESHGMVGNYMFDKYHNARFESDKTPPVDFWWTEAEPIWTTTQKKGLNTAALWWDSCEIPHDNITPRICTAYRPISNWTNVDSDVTEALVQTLRRFQRNETKLELLYYENIDHVGHINGVDSVERVDAVRRSDKIINNVLDNIEAFYLSEQVNVIIVSDHGMTNTSRFKIINLTSDSFDPNDIQHIVQDPTFVMIDPKPGRESKVISDLLRANIEGVDIYNKTTIPEYYHIKNNNRTLSIIIVAKLGYNFFSITFNFEPTPPGVIGSGLSIPGNHGYDPYSTRDMRAIFYGIGPAFKKGYRCPPLEMVDHYNTICHVLGIGPLPNNGSWERVRDMFVYPEKTQALY